MLLRNFAYKALKWEFSNEWLCGLLVAADFTKGNGTRAEAMGFLHASDCREVLEKMAI